MSVRFVIGACTYLYKHSCGRCVCQQHQLGAQGFTQGAARAQQSLQNRPDVDTRDILEATSHKGIRGPSGKRLEGPQSDGVSWA